VLGHFGVERAAVVGCSQGGSALGLALDQPERVSALVLLCPGIPGFPMDEDEEEDDELGEIAVPAALMVGDADYPPLIEADRQAAARIPGCEFTFVPGMDHLPPLREPALELDLITRTLERAGWYCHRIPVGSVVSGIIPPGSGHRVLQVCFIRLSP
jgi:3-oxoadipate enol-lactonase